jgi:non-heme chloroperoxidase
MRSRNVTYSYSSISTDDGVAIRYLDVGAGSPIVMLHGLGQTAAQFEKQINDLGLTHRVIGVDLRGHGESDKPSYGYRIARLAEDLHQLISGLDLADTALLGHSMGCSVIWSYLDQFGADRIAKLVLVDQPPCLVADPTWPPGQAGSLSAILAPLDVYIHAAQLIAHRRLAGTPTMSATDRAFFADRHSLFPAEHEATLLINHAFQDWRDVIPRIAVPTLVVGGTSMARGAEWVASKIPNSRLELFTAEELGSHFMFWENPTKFNTLVRDFIDSDQ